MKTVLLTSDTVGITDTEIKEGNTVTVSLHDENGLPIEEAGVIAEILTGG